MGSRTPYGRPAFTGSIHVFAGGGRPISGGEPGRPPGDRLSDTTCSCLGVDLGTPDVLTSQTRVAINFPPE